jgi:hypothetical protein
MANSVGVERCALLDVWEKISSGRADVNVMRRLAAKELDLNSAA